MTIKALTTPLVNEDSEDSSGEEEDNEYVDPPTAKISTFRWKGDVLNHKLINAYETHQSKFSNPRYRAKKVWFIIAREICTKLTALGYFDLPTVEQCEGRWKTLMSQYRNACDLNNQSGSGRKESPYFRELQAINGDKPNVVPLSTCSSSGVGDNDR